MSVRFAHLDEWVDISGFKIKTPMKGLEIKYKLPKTILFNIGKNFFIKVSFEVSYPTLSNPQIEASVKQYAWVCFCPSLPKKFEEYMKTIFTMQNFLTLAISDPTYPTAIEGKTESEKFTVDDKEVNNSIDVLFRQQSYVLKPILPLHALAKCSLH